MCAYSFVLHLLPGATYPIQDLKELRFVIEALVGVQSAPLSITPLLPNTVTARFIACTGSTDHPEPSERDPLDLISIVISDNEGEFLKPSNWPIPEAYWPDANQLKIVS